LEGGGNEWVVFYNGDGAVSGRTNQIFLMQRAGYSYKEIAFAIKPRTVEEHVDPGATAIDEHFTHGTLLTSAVWFKQC